MLSARRRLACGGYLAMGACACIRGRRCRSELAEICCLAIDADAPIFSETTAGCVAAGPVRCNFVWFLVRQSGG
jgi:hypothetical protein